MVDDPRTGGDEFGARRLSRWAVAVVAAVALTILPGIVPTAAQTLPVFTISTENTESHVQTRIVAGFADRLQQAWSDRIEVRHVHSGGLFRDRDVVEAMARGQVDMAVPGTWQLDRYEPSVALFMLPMFYGRDRTDIDGLRDGAIGEEVSARLMAATGTVVPGRWIDLGFAHLFTVDATQPTYAALADTVVRIPGGLAHERRLQALGLDPVSVAWGDVRAALDAGRIGALLSTFESVASQSLWENGIAAVLEDRQYFAQYIPMISQRFWNRLTEADRTALREAWEAGVDAGRDEAAAAQNDARERLLAADVTIRRLEPETLETERVGLMAAQPGIAEALSIPPPLIDRAQRVLSNVGN